MPVHLGSMGESVKAVIREREGKSAPGDVFVLNAPYNGGTHLPDVTVITPVFDEAGAARSCSMSARAAIMPISAASRRARCRPNSTTVEEEGVLFDNVLLVERGRFREAEALAILNSGRYPVRNPRAEHRRSEGPDRGLREGRGRSCAAWWRSSASMSCTPT